ncbi:hypothetical protein GZL_07302 [Streptomyces sp. 769]|nr:hypothetical protein GZL_07302 [Streptomyces sp. 769]
MWALEVLQHHDISRFDAGLKEIVGNPAQIFQDRGDGTSAQPRSAANDAIN